MAYGTIGYAVTEPGIATITLDQPQSRNALTWEMLDELLAAFAAARDDAGVRCVVLTSSHERVFSAGAALQNFAADAPPVHKHDASARFPQLFRVIGELGKPTICAANGHVLGGALGIALACDLIVAKDTARFGTPEIDVGVFPFMIMALVYRNVPRKQANELLLLGGQIGAEDAARMGIVNRAVPGPEFEPAVREWAQRLAAKPSTAMRLGKDAMFRQQDMAFADALGFLRAQLVLALSTEDAREGVSAFLEKRDPKWKAR